MFTLDVLPVLSKVMCTHYRTAFFATTKSYKVWYEKQRPGLEQEVFTHRTSRQSGWPRGFGALNSSSLSSFSGFQSSLLLVHFRYSPNTCSHCIKVWHRPYPICVAQLSRSLHRYRNRPVITVLMCEEKVNLVWF